MVASKFTVSVAEDFKNWTLSNYDHLNLTRVETSGMDLDEMLSNAVIYLENWHGGEGPNWKLGDLPSADYAELERMFAEALTNAQECHCDVIEPETPNSHARYFICDMHKAAGDE